MVSSAGWWSGVEAAAGHLGVVWCGVVVWRQLGILVLVEIVEGGSATRCRAHSDPPAQLACEPGLGCCSGR